jgi:papain like protease
MRISIAVKQIGILVLLAVPMIGSPYLSRIAGAQPPAKNTDANNMEHYRPIKIEPVRIHIDRVEFKDEEVKPEVDLRPNIESMGIAIRDQGDRGTCSVFAMTFLLEYNYGKHFDFKKPDFSEEYLNDVKNLATGDDWDGGFFTDIDKGYQEYGIVNARLDPYKNTFNPKEKVSKALLTKGEEIKPRLKAHYIKDWDVKTGLKPKQLAAILSRLRSGIPVASGLRWPNTFETETIRGIPVMKVPGPSGVTDGHSIDFVGFRQCPHFPGGGYFIFRNSWGTSFQEDGYGYMPFQYAMKYANDVVEYVP